MSKKIISITLGCLFIVVFNVLFFLLRGNNNTAATWISYAFIHLAYFSLLLVSPFTKGNKGLAILSGTLYLISIGYFFAELAAGLVFIMLATEVFIWALLIQLLLFAAFWGNFLAHVWLNLHTQKAIETQKAQSNYIKTAATALQLLIPHATNEQVRKQVEKCYDLMQNSPLQSNGMLEKIDADILNSINSLRNNITNQDQALNACQEIQTLIKERNCQLKNLNHLN